MLNVDEVKELRNQYTKELKRLLFNVIANKIEEGKKSDNIYCLDEIAELIRTCENYESHIDALNRVLANSNTKTMD